MSSYVEKVTDLDRPREESAGVAHQVLDVVHDEVVAGFTSAKL